MAQARLPGGAHDDGIDIPAAALRAAQPACHTPADPDRHRSVGLLAGVGDRLGAGNPCTRRALAVVPSVAGPDSSSKPLRRVVAGHTA
jgi:hypothetical protein